MKKYIILLPLLVLILAQCNEDPNTNSGTFTMNFDGTPWTADVISSTLSKTTDTATNEPIKVLEIRGIKDNGERMILTLIDYSDKGLDDCFPAGEYNLRAAQNFCDSVQGSLVVCNSMQGLYIANITNQFFTRTDGQGDGNITMNSCTFFDQRIAGTFDFWLYNASFTDSVQVSGGAFQDVTYTIQ